MRPASRRRKQELGDSTDSADVASATSAVSDSSDPLSSDRKEEIIVSIQADLDLPGVKQDDTDDEKKEDEVRVRISSRISQLDEVTAVSVCSILIGSGTVSRSLHLSTPAVAAFLRSTITLCKRS